MKKVIIAVLMASLSACGGGTTSENSSAGVTETRQITTLDGNNRSYHIHIPGQLSDAQTVPLVLAFHGGGTDGKDMEAISGFNHLSDQDGVIVVYPDALIDNWNDGRESSAIDEQVQNIDDIGFIEQLIDEIVTAYPVDEARVYAVGISNGGIFSHYLASVTNSPVKAIATLAANLAEPLSAGFLPQSSLPVMMISGDADNFMPFDGGGVGLFGGRGEVISAQVTAEKWAVNNGFSISDVTVTSLPEQDLDDGTSVILHTWGSGTQQVVEFYEIQGGGHHWPYMQVLPTQTTVENQFGTVSRELDASQLVWDFLLGL
jgi:polyhydroxybutyrate depolymerase